MRISRFSPNWSDPDDLEAITVAREDLIAGAVDSVRQSALTKNKHHLLFVGPRGSGKTHLVTLVQHRVSQMGDVMKKLRVAWLNEDETSDTLLSLLLRAHRSLAKEYPEEFPADSTEPIYDLTDRSEATEAAADLLLSQLGKNTLLLLVENLDALFHDFDEGEQKRWRALIQNHPQFCTVATAQRLFHGVADRDAPFFGFFQVTQLKPFTVAHATDLLAKIAARKKQGDLAAFLTEARGRARIRALHHLTGGNQRLFIILSEFITRESLDALVQPFEELVDEQLTPYYQERLRWLPTLQRKIVEFLCTVSKPTSVKDIARQLFSTSQTISSQLKDLRRIGYLESQKRGRESLYELAEPLMRLSYQVKEAKGRAPLRLLVDFLRVWYDHDELEQRLKSASSEAQISKMYFSEAHARSREEGSLRLRYFLEDAEGIDLLRDLKEESGDPEHALRYGFALASHGDLNEARITFSAVVEMEGTPTNEVAWALYARGIIHGHLEDSEAAIADFSAVVEMDGAPADRVANALINRGVTHGQLGDFEAEIADYSAVVEMDGAPADQVAKALRNRGFSHGQLGDCEAEIADYSAVIEMEGAPAGDVAEALFNRGVTHGQLGDSEAAIADYSAVVGMRDTPADKVAMALYNRGVTHGQLGDSEAAIADYSAVVEMDGAPAEVAMALNNRGVTHGQLGDSQAAIADYSAVVEMEGAPADQVAMALVNRGVTHGHLGDFEAAVADYSAVVEMEGAPADQVAMALVNRGVTRGQLGDSQAAIADLNAIFEIECEDKSMLSRAHFALAEIMMPQKEWSDAYRHLRSGFSFVESSESSYLGNVPAYLTAILNSGSSRAPWQPNTDRLMSLYAENNATARLAKGLVDSLSALPEANLSSEGLAAWHSLWVEYAERYPEFELPARLLCTAIDYFAAGEDRSVLLDLASEERRILVQALDIETPDSKSDS